MEICIMGTAGAVAGPHRDNTYLLARSGEELVLIDCGGSPIQKMRRIGVDALSVKAVLITHNHIDHWYGIPSLLHGLRLLGRKEGIDIYCTAGEPELLKRVLEGIDFSRRPEFFPIRYISNPVTKHPLDWELQFQGTVFPVDHAGYPTLGVALKGPDGRRIVYSSDTRPTESLMEVARKADLLVHECTFPHRHAKEAGRLGHSTAFQAARVARKCDVGRLVLVHVDTTMGFNPDELLEEAKEVFPNTELPEDLTWF
jgi:ribonuclease Z